MYLEPIGYLLVGGDGTQRRVEMHMENRDGKAGLIPVTERVLPMSNETRGHGIKRRRMAFGLGHQPLEALMKEKAGQSGYPVKHVSREKIKEAEAGTASDEIYDRLEAWLDALESDNRTEAEDAAMAAGEVEAPAGSDDIIEFRVSGIFGVRDVVARGRGDEVRRQIAKLLIELQQGQSGQSE